MVQIKYEIITFLGILHKQQAELILLEVTKGIAGHK
jgi:hypothetical protein